MTTACHIVVHGRVQGVGFRAWTCDTACDLGLTGWVRNRDDGTVEALVEGDADAVRKMRDRIGKGPMMSKVEHVEARDAEPIGDVDFEIRR